ncbi:MAG: hypothetical protein AB7V50_07915 [Vampirovibrionia bacterium]
MEKNKLNQNLHAVLNDISFPMNAPTIMSKAWRLYLLNFKDYKYYIIVPFILITTFMINVDFSPKTVHFMDSFLIQVFLIIIIIFGLSFFIISYIQGFYNYITGKSTKYTDVLDQLSNNKTITSYFFIHSILFMLPSTLLLFFFNPIIYILAITNTDLSDILYFPILLFCTSCSVYMFFYICITFTINIIEKIKLYKTTNLSNNIINKTSKKTYTLITLLILIFTGLLILHYIIPNLLYYWVLTTLISLNVKTSLFIYLIVLKLLNIINIFIITPLIAGSTVLLYMNYKATTEGQDLIITLNNSKETENSDTL